MELILLIYLQNNPSLALKTLYTKTHRSFCLPAGAAFLHHLCSVVPRQLAETIVAVDNGPVNYLSISQDKVGICLKVNRKKMQIT